MICCLTAPSHNSNQCWLIIFEHFAIIAISQGGGVGGGGGGGGGVQGVNTVVADGLAGQGPVHLEP